MDNQKDKLREKELNNGSSAEADAQSQPMDNFLNNLNNHTSYIMNKDVSMDSVVGGDKSLLPQATDEKFRVDPTSIGVKENGNIKITPNENELTHEEEPLDIDMREVAENDKWGKKFEEMGIDPVQGLQDMHKAELHMKATNHVIDEFKTGYHIFEYSKARNNYVQGSSKKRYIYQLGEYVDADPQATEEEQKELKQKMEDAQSVLIEDKNKSDEYFQSEDYKKLDPVSKLAVNVVGGLGRQIGDPQTLAMSTLAILATAPLSGTIASSAGLGVASKFMLSTLIDSLGGIIPTLRQDALYIHATENRDMTQSEIVQSIISGWAMEMGLRGIGKGIKHVYNKLDGSLSKPTQAIAQEATEQVQSAINDIVPVPEQLLPPEVITKLNNGEMSIEDGIKIALERQMNKENLQQLASRYASEEVTENVMNGVYYTPEPYYYGAQIDNSVHAMDFQITNRLDNVEFKTINDITKQMIYDAQYGMETNSLPSYVMVASDKTPKRKSTYVPQEELAKQGISIDPNMHQQLTTTNNADIPSLTFLSTEEPNVEAQIRETVLVDVNNMIDAHIQKLTDAKNQNPQTRFVELDNAINEVLKEKYLKEFEMNKQLYQQYGIKITNTADNHIQLEMSYGTELPPTNELITVPLTDETVKEMFKNRYLVMGNVERLNKEIGDVSLDRLELIKTNILNNIKDNNIEGYQKILENLSTSDINPSVLEQIRAIEAMPFLDAKNKELYKLSWLLADDVHKNMGINLLDPNLNITDAMSSVVKGMRNGQKTYAKYYGGDTLVKTLLNQAKDTPSISVYHTAGSRDIDMIKASLLVKDLPKGKSAYIAGGGIWTVKDIQGNVYVIEDIRVSNHIKKMSNDTLTSQKLGHIEHAHPEAYNVYLFDIDGNAKLVNSAKEKQGALGIMKANDTLYQLGEQISYIARHEKKEQHVHKSKYRGDERVYQDFVSNLKQTIETTKKMENFYDVMDGVGDKRLISGNEHVKNNLRENENEIVKKIVNKPEIMDIAKAELGVPSGEKLFGNNDKYVVKAILSNAQEKDIEMTAMDIYTARATLQSGSPKTNFDMYVSDGIFSSKEVLGQGRNDFINATPYQQLQSLARVYDIQLPNGFTKDMNGEQIVNMLLDLALTGDENNVGIIYKNTIIASKDMTVGSFMDTAINKVFRVPKKDVKAMISEKIKNIPEISYDNISDIIHEGAKESLKHGAETRNVNPFVARFILSDNKINLKDIGKIAFPEEMKQINPTQYLGTRLKYVQDYIRADKNVLNPNYPMTKENVIKNFKRISQTEDFQRITNLLFRVADKEEMNDVKKFVKEGVKTEGFNKLIDRINGMEFSISKKKLFEEAPYLDPQFQFKRKKGGTTLYPFKQVSKTDEFKTAIDRLKFVASDEEVKAIEEFAKSGKKNQVFKDLITRIRNAEGDDVYRNNIYLDVPENKIHLSKYNINEGKYIEGSDIEAMLSEIISNKKATPMQQKILETIIQNNNIDDVKLTDFARTVANMHQKLAPYKADVLGNDVYSKDLLPLLDEFADQIFDKKTLELYNKLKDRDYKGAVSKKIKARIKEILSIDSPSYGENPDVLKTGNKPYVKVYNKVTKTMDKPTAKKLHNTANALKKIEGATGIDIEDMFKNIESAGQALDVINTDMSSRKAPQPKPSLSIEEIHKAESFDMLSNMTNKKNLLDNTIDILYGGKGKALLAYDGDRVVNVNEALLPMVVLDEMIEKGESAEAIILAMRKQATTINKENKFKSLDVKSVIKNIDDMVQHMKPEYQNLSDVEKIKLVTQFVNDVNESLYTQLEAHRVGFVDDFKPYAMVLADYFDTPSEYFAMITDYNKHNLANPVYTKGKLVDRIDKMAQEGVEKEIYGKPLRELIRDLDSPDGYEYLVTKFGDKVYNADKVAWVQKKADFGFAKQYNQIVTDTIDKSISFMDSKDQEITKEIGEALKEHVFFDKDNLHTLIPDEPHWEMTMQEGIQSQVESVLKEKGFSVALTKDEYDILVQEGKKAIIIDDIEKISDNLAKDVFREHNNMLNAQYANRVDTTTKTVITNIGRTLDEHMPNVDLQNGVHYNKNFLNYFGSMVKSTWMYFAGALEYTTLPITEFAQGHIARKYSYFGIKNTGTRTTAFMDMLFDTPFNMATIIANRLENTATNFLHRGVLVADGALGAINYYAKSRKVARLRDQLDKFAMNINKYKLANRQFTIHSLIDDIRYGKLTSTQRTLLKLFHEPMARGYSSATDRTFSAMSKATQGTIDNERALMMLVRNTGKLAEIHVRTEGKINARTDLPSSVYKSLTHLYSPSDINNLLKQALDVASQIKVPAMVDHSTVSGLKQKLTTEGGWLRKIGSQQFAELVFLSEEDLVKLYKVKPQDASRLKGFINAYMESIRKSNVEVSSGAYNKTNQASMLLFMSNTMQSFKNFAYEFMHPIDTDGYARPLFNGSKFWYQAGKGALTGLTLGGMLLGGFYAFNTVQVALSQFDNNKKKELRAKKSMAVMTDGIKNLGFRHANAIMHQNVGEEFFDQSNEVLNIQGTDNARYSSTAPFTDAIFGAKELLNSSLAYIPEDIDTFLYDDDRMNMTKSQLVNRYLSKHEDTIIFANKISGLLNKIFLPTTTAYMINSAREQYDDKYRKDIANLQSDINILQSNNTLYNKGVKKIKDIWNDRFHKEQLDKQKSMFDALETDPNANHEDFQKMNVSTLSFPLKSTEIVNDTGKVIDYSMPQNGEKISFYEKVNPQTYKFNTNALRQVALQSPIVQSDLEQIKTLNADDNIKDALSENIVSAHINSGILASDKSIRPDTFRANDLIEGIDKADKETKDLREMIGEMVVAQQQKAYNNEVVDKSSIISILLGDSIDMQPNPAYEKLFNAMYTDEDKKIIQQIWNNTNKSVSDIIHEKKRLVDNFPYYNNSHGDFLPKEYNQDLLSIIKSADITDEQVEETKSELASSGVLYSEEDVKKLLSFGLTADTIVPLKDIVNENIVNTLNQMSYKVHEPVAYKSLVDKDYNIAVDSYFKNKSIPEELQDSIVGETIQNIVNTKFNDDNIKNQNAQDILLLGKVISENNDVALDKYVDEWAKATDWGTNVDYSNYNYFNMLSDDGHLLKFNSSEEAITSFVQTLPKNEHSDNKRLYLKIFGGYDELPYQYHDNIKQQLHQLVEVNKHDYDINSTKLLEDGIQSNSIEFDDLSNATKNYLTKKQMVEDAMGISIDNQSDTTQQTIRNTITSPQSSVPSEISNDIVNNTVNMLASDNKATMEYNNNLLDNNLSYKSKFVLNDVISKMKDGDEEKDIMDYLNQNPNMVKPISQLYALYDYLPKSKSMQEIFGKYRVLDAMSMKEFEKNINISSTKDLDIDISFKDNENYNTFHVVYSKKDIPNLVFTQNKQLNDNAVQTLQAVIDTAQARNFPVELLMAQWALESGWGTANLKGKNNYFNIKGDGSDGSTVTTALEYDEDNNPYIDKSARFKNYKTIEDGFNDYMDLMERKYFTDGKIDFKKLKAYATDPQYVSKIQSLMKTFQSKLDGIKEISNGGYHLVHSDDVPYLNINNNDISITPEDIQDNAVLSVSPSDFTNNQSVNATLHKVMQVSFPHAQSYNMNLSIPMGIWLANGMSGDIKNNNLFGLREKANGGLSVGKPVGNLNINGEYKHFPNIQAGINAYMSYLHKNLLNDKGEIDNSKFIAMFPNKHKRSEILKNIKFFSGKLKSKGKSAIKETKIK